MLKSLLAAFFHFSIVFCHSLSADQGIRDAKDYQNNSNLQWKWAIESLENFPLDESDKVLDLGCGSGSITAVIASKVPSGIVIGLDISNIMLDFARENYPAANIIYMLGDARRLPFVAQFDKVIAMLSLNWVNEQEQALASLFSALKPGGKAIITRPGKKPTNLGPVAERLIKTDRWSHLFPDFKQTKRYYDAEEYTQLLEAAGFEVESINQDPTYTYFKDIHALMGFFRPLCNFMGHLSDDLQTLFIEELVSIILSYEPASPDGSILLYDLKLEAVVTKPIENSNEKIYGVRLASLQVDEQ